MRDCLADRALRSPRITRNARGLATIYETPKYGPSIGFCFHMVCIGLYITIMWLPFLLLAQDGKGRAACFGSSQSFAVLKPCPNSPPAHDNWMFSCFRFITGPCMGCGRRESLGLVVVPVASVHSRLMGHGVGSTRVENPGILDVSCLMQIGWCKCSRCGGWLIKMRICSGRTSTLAARGA